MGGGNLNLKKSWHPSTLKNQEKVWKVEQQSQMEKKKVEELQREIQAQREKEEYQEMVNSSKGDSDKKPKMDWMYQGVSGLVDREDYLLGRKVDKTFDVIQAAEEGEKPTQERSEGLPSQLFKKKTNDVSYVPVDMAAKVREDPLYLIKKQEYNSKKQLLSNPIKMKMLQGMIAKQQKKPKKKHKKHKKGKRNEDSDSGNEEDIDAKLLRYREKLFGKETSPEERQQPEKMDDRRHQMDAERRRYDDRAGRNNDRRFKDDKRQSRDDRGNRTYRSERESPRRSSSRERHFGRSRRRQSEERNSSRKEPRAGSRERRRGENRRREDSRDRKRDRSRERDQELRRDRSRERTDVKRLDRENAKKQKSPDKKQTERSRSRSPPKRQEYGLIKMRDDSNSKDDYAKKDYRAILEERKRQEEKDRKALEEDLRNKKSRKMTAEEKADKLREMQQDAAVREKQREEYVKRHTKADAIAVSDYREGGFKGAEMLSKAVDSSSVERRVKSNIKNAQRSSRAMESNFLRK